MGFLKKIFKPVSKVVGVIIKPIGKLLKKWLAPDLPEKEGLALQRAGSDINIPVVYGTRMVGGIRVDLNVSDSAGGLLNENCHALYVFCHGEIDSFVEFFFNDVSWNDKRFEKDGVKMFTVQTALGTDTQTPLSGGTVFNRWDTAQSHYKGLAIALFTFKQDPEATIWNGEPQVTAIIRGKKCLDFVTATTAYTENPAVHMYDYIKSTVYGLGLADSEIDVASLTAVRAIANTTETATVDTQVCEVVNGVYVCTGSPAAVVQFKRFSNNTIIDTSRTLFENLQELALPFRGFFPDSDGRIKVGTEIEGDPVFAFNADNIASSITSTTPSIRERFNRVVVRFPNVANKYKMDECFYPAASDPIYAQWLAEDNNLPLEKVVTADYTVYKAEALQLAELIAKVSRNAETVQFTATAEAMQVDVGDIISITEENRGWIAKEFRVSDIEYREDYYVNISAIQHEDGAYPWSLVDYSEIIGGSNLGNPANIAAPTGLSIVPDPTFATAGLLSWASQNNAFIRRFEITVLNGSSVIYRTESLAQNWPIPLLNPASYSIQVRAVSSIGTVSPAATISITLAQPAMPTDINFTVGNFEIEARPVLASAGLGTTFEFALNSASPIRGRGVSIVFTGLLHSTEYTIYARTVNALGVSAWFTKIATTTANGANIVDLIGADVGAAIFDDVVTSVSAELETIVADATIDKIDATQAQALIDVSISRVNASESNDPRIGIADAMQSLIADYKTKDRISQITFSVEKEGQIRAGQILQLNADNQAALQRIDAVQAETSGNASAISAVSAQVNNPTNGLSATFTLANQAKVTADGAAASALVIDGKVSNPITGLEATRFLAQTAETTAQGAATTATTVSNQVNNPVTGLAATASIAQTAKTTADGAAESILIISQDITNLETGLSTTSGIAQQAKTTADGAALAVTEIRQQIDDPTNGLGAVASIANQAKITADGAASSITEITNDVSDLESGLSITTQTAQKALITADENNISANAVIGNIIGIMDSQNNKVSINNVSFAVIKEGQVRAQQVIELNAANQATLQQVLSVQTDLNGTNTALSQVIGRVNNPATGLSATFGLAQQAKTTADGAVSSISQIDGTISNPANGLSATYTIASQAKATADGAVESVNTINGAINNPATGLAATYSLAQTAKSTADGATASATAVTNTVNNPATGLAATATLAQQAKTTADGATSSAAAVTNTVNNPATGLAATATLAQQAKSTADGNTSAIAGLRVAVAGTDSQSQAELILSSTVDKANQSFARAFLGVTSTAGGITTINGIVVDGATNALEFRANTLRWSDTAGNVQMYWDAGRGKVVSLGDMVSGTFQTATSGYRAEMSGAGTIPFWYGTGAKSWENALFAVDSTGNIKITNAQMSGAFVGSNGSNRVEINNDGTYLVWAGAGVKNDANGIFWIKSDGTGFIKGAFFQGEIIESKLATASASNSANLSATINNHSSAGNPIDIQVNGFLQCSAGGNQANKTLKASVTVATVSGVILSYERYVNGVYDGEFAKTEWYVDYPNFISRAFLVGINWFTLDVVYSFSANPTGGLTVANNSCSIKTFENKLG